MPKVQKQPDILRRLAAVEGTVAMLQRTERRASEVPFFPTSFRGLVYEDPTGFTTVWETILTPRMGTLSLGLMFVGDQVSGVNTGGEWQLLLNSSTVLTSGSVPASFTYTYPTVPIDLTPYRGTDQLQVRLQVRRTSGATSGGRYGGGGAIGSSIRFARLI
ncbi:hypothetical protein SEA_ONIONKNIGHT_21 [Streptomyces phage OnionKnight]|nr:hypothetical protein SEA_ONIONKNIGHT_21 [Streptomyces phage OnionKnight]